MNINIGKAQMIFVSELICSEIESLRRPYIFLFIIFNRPAKF